MSIAIEGGYIVAFDGKEHRLLKDGVVVIEGDRIKHVGKTYAGHVDEKIDARGKLVSPGFINTHLHFALVSYKSFNEDLPGHPSMTFVSAITKENFRLFAKSSIIECLKSGNTTATVYSRIARLKGSMDICGQMGIRAYLGGRLTSRAPEGATAGEARTTEWDYDKGLKDLEANVDFIKNYDGAYDGRIKGMYTPGVPFDMTPDFYREIRKKADEVPAPINTHAAYSRHEFMTIIRRYGMTPIEFLDSCGFLKDDVIIGHGILVSGHSKAVHSWGDDLGIIAKRGCTVSHQTTTFAKVGMMYEAYSDYLARGINCTLGTDSPPYDIIRAMRWTAMLCKCATGKGNVGTAGDVYNSATLAGSKALKNDDLGRIAPGAKADIAIINLKSLHMSPVRDPIKNLVYYGHTTDVDTTIVDGKKLVENGKFLGLDEEKLLEQIQKATMSVFDRIPEHEPNHRTVDQLAPQTLKPWT